MKPQHVDPSRPRTPRSAIPFAAPFAPVLIALLVAAPLARALNVGEVVPGYAGRENTVVVSGATPGAEVVLTLGTELGPTQVPGCPGVTVVPDVTQVLGPRTADASGNVSFTESLPVSLLGKRFGFQAAEPSNCAVSAADTVSFPDAVDIELVDADAVLSGSFGENLGFSVAFGGDLNTDGFGDILLGAPRRDGVGATYVLYGPVTGDVQVGPGLGARLYGRHIDDHAGWSVAGAGDVDADGFDDLIVGAFKAGDQDEGGAYLVSGPVYGDLTLWSTATARMKGAADDQAGYAVSSAGDLNDDGFDDLIVGAPNGNTQDAGRVYILNGPVSGDVDLPTESTAMLIGHDALCEYGCVADWAGRTVVAGGDHDGDGFADVLVGAPHSTTESGGKSGAVYLVNGPVAPGSAELAAVASARIRGGGAVNYAGISVANAGDTNGDGYLDVLVGSHADDDLWAFLLLGPLAGDRVVDTAAEASFTGPTPPQPNRWFEGDIVAGAGDVDNDGFADVMIGAPGVGGLIDGGNGGAFVLHGALSGTIQLTGAQVRMLGPERSWSGKAIAGGGDVDADGLPDLLVGAADYGSFSGVTFLVAGASL